MPSDDEQMVIDAFEAWVRGNGGNTKETEYRGISLAPGGGIDKDETRVVLIALEDPDTFVGYLTGMIESEHTDEEDELIWWTYYDQLNGISYATVTDNFRVEED